VIEREARLNQSLAVLAPAGGGDWSDVVARSNAIGSARHRRRLLTIAIASTVLLLGAGTALAIGNRLFDWFSVSTPPGWFSVETSKSKAPATKGVIAYVAGQTLYRPHKRPQRLAYPLRPMFSDDNLVASSPDGRYIVYQTVLSKVFPMLYVHDTIARREKLLARGAMSAAWSRDGRIAYFKAEYDDYQQRPAGYIGQVVVQTLKGKPTVWTRRAARYEVLAWARGELIVKVDECLDVKCSFGPGAVAYALERSGKLRPLHLEMVTALSPDGRYALGTVPVGHDEFSPLLRLVRVDTGKIIMTINPTRSFQRAIPGLVKPEVMPLLPGYASWRGSEIACEFASGSRSWLAIFRLRSHRLELESIIRVPAGVVPKRKYGSYFGVPFLMGPGNAQIVVTVDVVGPEEREGVRAVLVCSRAGGNCAVGELFPYGSLWRAFGVVRNQSRPLTRPG
jgi:hypothetical protein